MEDNVEQRSVEQQHIVEAITITLDENGEPLIQTNMPFPAALTTLTLAQHKFVAMYYQAVAQEAAKKAVSPIVKVGVKPPSDILTKRS